MNINLFSVYKPPGKSSYDVIRQLKKKYPGEKIGHGGTLDPFAEGVLIIGVGRSATKQLGLFLNHSRKTYRATVHLGTVSTTDDPEGQKIECIGAALPTLSVVEQTLKKFIGEIWQTPSRFSALKINGERAYDKARRGEQVVMEPRQVFIEDVQLVSYSKKELVVEVTCGSGTYIRSIARALGEVWGTGAYLTRLLRTRVRVPGYPEYDFTSEKSEKIENPRDLGVATSRE
jgi:tRNA pseudouridine55 synthase